MQLPCSLFRVRRVEMEKCADKWFHGFMAMSGRTGLVVLFLIARNGNSNGNKHKQFSCCGYFAANDTLEVGGTFCTSQDFANSLPTNNTANFCVTPVTTFTDYALENTFTCVFLLLLHFLFSYSFAPSPSLILPQTTLYFPPHLTFVLFVFYLRFYYPLYAFRSIRILYFCFSSSDRMETNPTLSSHLLPSSTATIGLVTRSL